MSKVQIVLRPAHGLKIAKPARSVNSSARYAMLPSVVFAVTHLGEVKRTAPEYFARVIRGVEMLSR